MTRVFFDGRDVEVVLRRQGVEHVYPLASFAAVLQLETSFVRARIGALFKAREHLSTDRSVLSHPVVPNPSGMMLGEPTEGMVQPSIPIQEENITHHTNHPNHGSEMVERARGFTLDAHDVAAALGDDANPTALASTIRDVPVPVVREALAQALAVPNVRLRASRAALFTAIVRRMSHKNTTSTYARTEASST